MGLATDAELLAAIDDFITTESDPVASAALSAHAGLTENVHGVTDTSLVVVDDDPRLTDARTPTAHDHDDRYFTESEVDTALLGKSDTGHGHGFTEITGTASDAQIPGSIARDAEVASAVSTHTSSDVHAAPQPPIIGSTASTAVAGNDARLSDARTPTAHNHNATDVNAGTLGIARIPTGQTGTTVPFGNDARFSDARTPVAHQHNASDVNAGTLDIARVPTGTSGTTVALGNHTHAGGGGGPTYQTLALDALPNLTTTFVTVMTTTIAATGTYVFRYYLRYQSGATTTGVKFQLVGSGGLAVSCIPHTTWYQTTGGAAATGAADQATTTTAQLIEGWSGRALATPLGPSLSVDTTNADQLQVLEGLMIVTTAGDLLLQHASEVAAASTVKAGTSLILHKVA
jgi:hypothetical protein